MSDTKRLQAIPLGRPPQFKDPVTMPPFTAERKMRDVVEKLMAYHKVSKSEIMRRAIKIGIRAMINDIKQEREG